MEQSYSIRFANFVFEIGVLVFLGALAYEAFKDSGKDPIGFFISLFFLGLVVIFMVYLHIKFVMPYMVTLTKNSISYKAIFGRSSIDLAIVESIKDNSGGIFGSYVVKAFDKYLLLPENKTTRSFIRDIQKQNPKIKVWS